VLYYLCDKGVANKVVMPYAVKGCSQTQNRRGNSGHLKNEF